MWVWGRDVCLNECLCGVRAAYVALRVIFRPTGIIIEKNFCNQGYSGINLGSCVARFRYGSGCARKVLWKFLGQLQPNRSQIEPYRFHPAEKTKDFLILTGNVIPRGDSFRNFSSPRLKEGNETKSERRKYHEWRRMQANQLNRNSWPKQ